MQKLSINKTFCTTRESAVLLGVSVGTVILWVESGLLQAWKTPGGHRRVLRNSVVALLQQRPDSAPSPDAVKDRRVDNQPRMRILVLVHDPILRRLCEVTMSGWPMAPEIVATDNAVAGLVMMGRNCPDLLIIDLHIPGIDALQMLRSIRQTAELAQPTIVVIAGPHDARGNERGGIPTGIEVLPIPIPFHRLQSIASGIVTHPGFNRLARS